MLSNLIDKVVSTKLRHLVGSFIWRYIICRSRLLLYPYLYILTGKIPKGIKFLPNQECSAYGIHSTWDGIWIFMEIFQDEVYEKRGSPQMGDIVIDIGAYVGMFTVKASTLVGETGLVVAIEPAENNLSLLRQNTAGKRNVRIISKAVSSCIGKAKLYISDASPCHSLINSHKKYTEIETITIDALVSQLKLSRVDFIKIDAEGFEYEILKGAESVLSGKKLKLAIAAYHDLPNGKHEMPKLVSYLEARGFNVYTKGGYIYAQKAI